MRRGLSKIDLAFMRITKAEAVITSTYDGNHSPSSLHYAHLAVDLRMPRGLPATKLRDLEAGLKKSLGSDFDVLLERDHFHVEYDPKG